MYLSLFTIIRVWSSVVKDVLGMKGIPLLGSGTTAPIFLVKNSGVIYLIFAK
jgi:hypothetical protein